jgi:hypothetical protein
MQVVADTSLFNYLILIDQIALLPWASALAGSMLCCLEWKIPSRNV